MNQIISTRDFGRKGITPTPWIVDVIILFALSVVVMMVSHFILKEALYTSISSAFFFFCILGLLVFLAGFSVTKVCIKEGIIKTWSVYQPVSRTYRISQIETIFVKSNDWCRNNIILHMKDGKQHKLSVNEVDEFIHSFS